MNRRSVSITLLLLCSLGCGGPDSDRPAVTDAHGAELENGHDLQEAQAEPAATPDDHAPVQPQPSAHVIEVVDASGHPVSEARGVVLHGGYYRPIQGTAAQPLVADRRGQITLSLSEAQLEDALLLIWAPGHGALRFAIDPTGETREARLPPATALRGRLRGEHRRVEHVWLHATESSAAWPFFVRCDVEDGRFSVLGLEAGTYGISSRPLGGAPVLSADAQGGVRFLSGDPGPVPVHDYRLLDRELAADGTEHAIRVAVGRMMVGGQVLDEAGAPIAGAEVRFSSEGPGRTTVTTDARGHFEAAVRPSPNLRMVAAHPDYGAQWTDRERGGWSVYDEPPDAPVQLVLRRGVVLRGQLLDAHGAPRANQRLLMVPAYIGSGPTTLEVRTDARGRFAFQRAVLNHFELVPGSLREWNPRSRGRPGEHLRIPDDDHDRWLSQAAAGESIRMTLESYTLVATEIQLTDASGDAVPGRQVELWTRSDPEHYLGQIPRTDARGRVRVLLEHGVHYELWASVFAEGGGRTAPWTRNQPPLWTGTANAPTLLTLVAPER